MDRVKLVFPFDEINSDGSQGVRSKGRNESILASCVPLPFIKQLKAWISWLFEHNKSMVASKNEIHRNNLLEQVYDIVQLQHIPFN